jgi:hypothetical protein
MGGTFKMNPIDLIEKAINEHGSAEILKERLALAKDEFVALDRKASELERAIGKLEAKLEREQFDRDKAQQELQRLQKEHEEQILIQDQTEFRKGKRTGGVWVAFCPDCHMPARGIISNHRPEAICSKLCGWCAHLPTDLDAIIRSLNNSN